MKTYKSISSSLPSRLAISLISCAVSSVFAADLKDSDVKDLGAVGTKATADANATSKAAAAAPTKTSLDATQPKSIISRDYIENSASAVADFSAIAAIAPSVTLGISTNGPGLGETKNGIRGFNDGQFNITFDGIPFGDTNGPSHHSTAYFPASVIGEVVVERGPGNASDLGQATFGGSINLFSRPIANERVASPYFSFGTWNTKLLGARYDSGLLKDVGDAKFAMSYQKQTSDGYQTFSAIQGQNLMFKGQKPVGENTLVTVNLNYNRNWYRTSDVVKGLTAAQAAKFGKNYLLSDDPNKANYYGYNIVNKDTVMNYVRVQSDLGSGWAIDNNFYYYNYTNVGISSLASDVETGLGTVIVDAAGTTKANQMPGYTKVNEYWVSGNILKLTKQTGAGLARVGLWYENADTHRSLYDYNLLDGTAHFAEKKITGLFNDKINNVSYEQNSGWNQYQPFAEFEWAVNDQLKVIPGIKYMHTTLTIDALVNQTARITQHVSKDFKATLPFLAANYKLGADWATYAQYAGGMLVPNIGNYQSTGADATTIDPQRSTNYQAGIIHKTDALVFDVDVYYIDFKNKIATVPGTSGANAVLFNQGRVEYKGVEAQLNYAFGGGFSAYINSSINRATTKASGLSIAGVPDTTAAIGVIYSQHGWSASLIEKRVGRTWALDGAAYRVDPYSSLDLNIGYAFHSAGMGFKSVKVSAGIFNLANHEAILSASAKNNAVGSATYGTVNAGDTFTYQPKRSSMVNVKTEF
jgi:iron complex outermembrane receptor protein